MLLAAVLAEFDDAIGRVVRLEEPSRQSPLLDAPTFAAVSPFVIPKPELTGKLVKLSLPRFKIVGFPVVLEDERYKRNAFFFNLCLLVEADAGPSAAYEPIAQKLANYLTTLERHSAFLSRHSTAQPHPLAALLRRLVAELNSDGECSIWVSELTTLHVKLCAPVFADEGARVAPYMVAVLTRAPPLDDAALAQLDVVAQKVLPQVDGWRSVADIGERARVDVELVGRSLRALEFFGVVTLVPLFEYRAVYAPTGRLQRLAHDDALMQECRETVGLDSIDDSPPLPLASDVLRLYCGFKTGARVSEWCAREQPRRLGVDERRLVQWAAARRLLRRVFTYPIAVSGRQRTASAIVQACDGSRCLEDIACMHGVIPSQLERLLEADDTIVFVHK